MIERMLNKDKILEKLKGNELTVKELADNSDFNENEIRTYIHRLIDNKLVEKIGKKNRWVIYKAISKESINDLDKFRNGFNQYHILFKKLTKTDVTVENLKDLAKDTLDFNLLKQLEKELVK